MTTEITVFTGDADLVNRAKAQGQANRFARIENEQQAKTEQAAGELLQLTARWNSIALSRLGGRMFRHLFFSEEPIARRNASTGLLAFLLVPTEEFDTSIVGPFGDPIGAPYTSYGASPGLVLGYTNTYWTVTNWRPYFGYSVVGGVWRNVGRPVFKPLGPDEIDEISQQILPPVFQDGSLKGPILKSKRRIDSGNNFFRDPWMERTIAEVHLAHAVAARTNFRYRYDTSQERLEYEDNTPLSLQPGPRNAMTLEFIVQLGNATLKEDGGTLKYNQGLPYTEIMGLNQLSIRLEGYASGIWGQGAYGKFDLYLRQGHGSDENSSTLLNFQGGQSVPNDPESGDIIQYDPAETREAVWRPDYDYNSVGTKTLVGVNSEPVLGESFSIPITFKTAQSLAARLVHCALVFTNQQTRLYIEGSLSHTAPPAPRLLSAQTMRCYGSVRDSAYKEYAGIRDQITEAGGVTMNADLFDFGTANLIQFITIVLGPIDNWSGEEKLGELTEDSDNVDIDFPITLYPVLAMNGQPWYGGSAPGVKTRFPWRVVVSEPVNTSIRDRSNGMVKTQDPSIGSESVVFQRYTIYDQFGNPFEDQFAQGSGYTGEVIHNLNWEWSGFNQNGVGTGKTIIIRRYLKGMLWNSARVSGRTDSLTFDQFGELIDAPTLVSSQINPRSTIFNGPSRLSGIRLTSRELYTGNTVQVPSVITSLNPDDDQLSTPGGGGGGGGGGEGLG